MQGSRSVRLCEHAARERRQRTLLVSKQTIAANEQ